jgi:cytochrome c peroxidase
MPPIDDFSNSLLGVLGFNVPSLLSTNYHAPYFHNGAAQTLEDVFPLHALGGGTIQSVLSEGDRNALLAFLKALDGRTAIFDSQTDIFKDPFRGPCC